MRRETPVKLVVWALLAAVALGAAFADAATASPVWKFNGTALTGGQSETVLSHALESTFTVPGLKTTCKPTVFGMTVSNPSGAGKASITTVPLSNCVTNSAFCEVAAISPSGLPWTASLATVSSQSYIAISGFEVRILYEGALCALDGVEITIDGSAGGLIGNATESITFDNSSFSATGTSLLALGSTATWGGVFTMVATGSRLGQSLTVS
jgi:hypothetical protein